MMLFFELFITFFKIGLFTIGGGYAMLPLIQDEVVAHGWMTLEEIVNFIAVSESTPGPLAVNISTYIGAETGSAMGLAATFFGSFCATAGVVLPSFIIILLVARIYNKFKKSKVVNGCMAGLKPAVIGLIGAAVVSVGKTVFVLPKEGFISPELCVSAAVFVVMTFLAFKKTHPIVIICISALVGIIAGYTLGV